jgi:poly(A) polymerase
MTVPSTPGSTLSLAGAEWLTRPQTKAVFAALAACGHEARAVGGAVRNALLGRTVVDIDIATTARPEEAIAAAKAAGIEAVPTGLAHGTVTVIIDHVPYEVTTLREDVETHGRHATVAFTDDWAADARRRDFTINALYCSSEGEVFDPLGGAGDVAARRVRFIGDAGERIREDYLRILRFFRLMAEYGEGTPDAAALAACVRERDGLQRLSAERVRQEMLRLLAAPRGSELVRVMLDYGLLPLVLGAAPRPSLLERLIAILRTLALPPEGILGFAALVVEVPEDAVRQGFRLRLSNDEQTRLMRLAARMPEIGPGVPEAAARAGLYAEGTAAYRDRVLIAWARSGDASSSTAWRDRFALPERWQPPRFPLGGADVIALGVPAGPRVGEILRELEAWWIAGDFAADKTELQTHLAQLTRQPVRRPNSQ